MARPIKQGLEYFPVDVYIDQDDKIQLIEAEHGLIGFSIVIKLLMKIYSQGYFYEWDKRQQLLFSRRVNVDINTVCSVVNACINWGLFSNEMYENYSILTSHGIQLRYIQALSRRKTVYIDKQHLLLTKEELKPYKNVTYGVSVDNNEVNVNNNSLQVELMPTESTQSKVKESKVKESTEKHHHYHDNMADVEANQFTYFQYLEQEFGRPIKKSEVDALIGYEKTFSNDMITEAIKRSVLNQVFTVVYVTGILQNWLNKGIKTLADVKREDAQHKLKKGQGKNRSRSPSGVNSNISSVYKTRLNSKTGSGLS